MAKKWCNCCIGINASIPVTADKYTYTITSVLTGKLTWTPINKICHIYELEYILPNLKKSDILPTCYTKTHKFKIY